MQKFWLKIIAGKSNPLYFPFIVILWILSVFYRIGLIINKAINTKVTKLNIPVISVGNLTVGGSGKTPIVIEIAKYLTAKGVKTGIVSSGYGRSVRFDYFGKGTELTDKNNNNRDIDNVGDEVMMMAELLPDIYFSISESKTKAAQILADKNNVDIIVIDDGYQHQKLHRDLNILLIDATLDVKNESLLPLGRLREPYDEITRADSIILTKTNLANAFEKLNNSLKNQTDKILIAQAEFDNTEIISTKERINLGELNDARVYFFAGIGNFKFVADNLKKRLNIVGLRQFRDHCRYSRTEPRKIRNDIEKYKPDYIITTHKDFVKVCYFDFTDNIYYLDLDVKFKIGRDNFFGQIEKVAGL